MKKDNFGLKEESKNLSSRLEIALQERDEISSERDSLKSQLDLALNENKILKNKNDYENVLKKNKDLTSKLDFLLKENESLKKKISSISKELDLVSKKNISLKNDLDSHVCHTSVASYSSSPIACTSSSMIENDFFAKEEYGLFGLHFEPLYFEPYTFGIYVSKEASSSYACIQTTAYTCSSCSHT